ncbi:MAG: hypothetical protein FJ147_08090 [Deltaproteobacteria bacterium]|nr:hypothetical protein [Deltaproteobacteria bacterium]
MNRTLTIAAAALLIAGATYPILALNSNQSNEAVTAVEKKDEVAAAVEVKPAEPMTTDATATAPSTETQEVKTVEPMAKDATSPVTSETKEIEPSTHLAKNETSAAPAKVEAKPATTVNTPSVTETVTGEAKDAVKDKVVDTVKDKALDTATSGMKTPSVPSVPGVK